MALIGRDVIRNGEWVSESGRDDIKDGEPCVEITDSYGCYMYKLSLIPPRDSGLVRILDSDNSGEKENKFDNFLREKNLPIYFKKGE